MASRRFTLAGLLLWITLIGLVLAFVVPLWRYRQRARGLADQVTEIAMSADGSTAAAMTGDGTLWVWDLARGTHQTTITTGGGLGGSLALSADGKLAALPSFGLSADGEAAVHDEIEIWDIASRERKRVAPADLRTQVFFSPTQNTLVVESVGAVILHFLESAGRRRPIAKAGAVAFSPDGRTLAVGESDGIHFYDTATLERREEAFASDLAAVCLTFSPDGKALAVLQETVGPRGGRRQVTIWDLATRAPRHTPVQPAGHFARNAISYLSGGKAIAVPKDYGLGVVDATTLEPIDSNHTFAQLATGLRGAHFVVANGGTVDLYDAATLQKVTRLLDANPKPNPTLPVLGLSIWLAVFLNPWMRSRLRVCARCGGRFAPEGKDDAGSECPTCRYQARLETLTADEAAREQRVQSRQTWRMLILIDVLVAAIVGVFCRDRFGFLPTFLAVAIGLPALVFIAVRLLRKWVVVLPSSLPAEIAMAERAAGSPGHVRHVGEVLVWSAAGASLAEEFEPQLEATRQRLAEVTGRLVSPSPKLRVFLFADGDGVMRHLQELGFRLEDRAARRGICLSASAGRLFVGERDARLQESDPYFTLRWLIARHLIEQAGVPVRRAWLIDGLAGMIAYESSEHERASLNRRAMAGIAAGRTISAVEWFANTPARLWLKSVRCKNLRNYVWLRQFQTQSRSLMEFLCGQGATPERRAAFQRLFHDPELQTRPGETFEQHFGCPIDELFAQWRAWVEQQGVGEHHPPPPHVAEYLAEEPLARILAADTRRRDRIEAIREWGERGYVFGAEQVVALLRGDDEELRAEALYALDCVSGLSLGTTAKEFVGLRSSVSSYIF